LPAKSITSSRLFLVQNQRLRNTSRTTASRRGGRLDFSKIEGQYNRLQPLAPRVSVLVAVYGQYAFTPLLVPERCGYGGRIFGRAFDPSELMGDHCWLASAELRYDVPPPGRSDETKAGRGRARHGVATIRCGNRVTKLAALRLHRLREAL
jgi:hemolysin activation/secretion protein